MAFKKGTSGNPKGKKPGTKNRTNEEVRQSLLKLLDDNLERLQADLDGMKGKDRATVLINLCKIVVPPPVNPERLTEAQMLQIIDYLKTQKQ